MWVFCRLRAIKCGVCFVINVSSLIVVLFLEVLLDISIFDLFNGLQLESVSLAYLTALTFTVLQSMESFSSSRPIDRTEPDDMEILPEER